MFSKTEVSLSSAYDRGEGFGLEVKSNELSFSEKYGSLYGFCILVRIHLNLLKCLCSSQQFSVRLYW